MRKKKSNFVLNLLLVFVIAGLGGYVVGYAAKNWVPTRGLDNLLGTAGASWENPLKVVMALLALWAALAVHELGHLLTGLAQGFRFQLYVAGFLGVRRNARSDQIEVYFNRDPNLFGGAAASVPIKKSPDLRFKLAAVVAAGPLSSLAGALLAGIPAFGLTLKLTPAASPAARLLLVFALIFALTSALLFLATTLPQRTGAFFTDRGRFFRLMGGGKTAAIEQAMLELMAQSYTQEPYRDMDPQQIELIKTDESPIMRIFAHSLHYYYHLDRGEKELALAVAQAMEPLLEEQPATFRAALQKDLVFAYAFLAKDAAKARECWEKTATSFQQQKDVQTLLAKTALLWVEGNLAEAKMICAQGLAVIPKDVKKYSDRFYGGFLEELKTEIDRESGNVQA
jgi:hypothetical protein